MLWDFYCGTCNVTEEHWARRDDEVRHKACGKPMDRCPGGKKMLYFEEGRQRTHWSLSNRPISSYKQQKALMKEHGLAEAGATPPPRMMKGKKGPVKPEMKELCAAQKGRWI